MRYGLFPFRCEGAALVTRSACGAKMRDACFSDALVDLINGYIVEKEAISSRSRSRSRSFALFSSRSNCHQMEADTGRHTLLQKKPVHHVALVAGLTSMKLRVETMARILHVSTLQQRRRSDAAERRAKRAVARANALASSTSRSVSTVAAGTLGTDGRRADERGERRKPAFPRAHQKLENYLPSGPWEWSRRGATLLASP